VRLKKLQKIGVQDDEDEPRETEAAVAGGWRHGSSFRPMPWPFAGGESHMEQFREP
jgi:hypothetical protein